MVPAKIDDKSQQKASTNVGFSLKFSKVYKNPVKTTKTLFEGPNHHSKQAGIENDHSRAEVCVTEFDGKQLQTNTTNQSLNSVAVIKSEPNSNKLYEKLYQLEDGSNSPLVRDMKKPSNKSYTRDDYLNEVKTLPEASKMCDYQHMPVSDFGKAMLRGMGWEEGSLIGLTNKGLVEPIEYIPRTKGLGLGAQSRSDFVNDASKPVTSKPNKNSKKSTYRYISEANKKEKDVADDYGLIRFGEWQGSYVRIIKNIVESNGCIVQFVNDVNKMESLNTNCLLKVSKEEALANSNYNEISSSNSDLKNWLVPHLYVRIVSKSFKNGKYYRQKARIIKVNNSSRCDLITDDSDELKDVPESVLQTVIPKNEDGIVLVLCGEHKNKKGHVVSNKNCMASVHFQDEDFVKLLPFDHICQTFSY